MSNRRIARRLRASSEFTCSLCGGHEAYSCQVGEHSNITFLNAMRVRPCAAATVTALLRLPMRLDDPILRGIERIAPIFKPQRAETPERAVYGVLPPIYCAIGWVGRPKCSRALATD